MDSRNTNFNFDLLHVNIRGIRANKSNLENYMRIHTPEIVTINESKLGNETPFHLDNYLCAARKEPNIRGGKRGSMILVSQKCKDAVEIDLPNQFKEEIIGIKLSKKGPRPNLNLLTYYNPPETEVNPAIFNFIASQPEPTILLGDLNVKNRAWGSTKTDKAGESLMEIIENNRLLFLNNGQKTRVDPISGKEEVLDLAICNGPAIHYFKSFEMGEEIGSDHYPMHVTLQFGTPKAEKQFYRPIHKARWDIFKYRLYQRALSSGINPPLKTGEELDSLSEEISKEIMEAFEECCPEEEVKPHHGSKFTQEMIEITREKRKLRRDQTEARRSDNPTLVASLQSHINRKGNDLKRLQKAKIKEDRNIECAKLNTIKDTNKFYKTLNSLKSKTLLQKSPSLRPLYDDTGQKASSTEEKVDLFANHLEKVHQDSNYHHFNSTWKDTVDNFITNNPQRYKCDPEASYENEEEGDGHKIQKRIKMKEFKQHLRNCKKKSAPGVDKVTYTMLKNLPKKYYNKIMRLYNASLRTGHFPTPWKLAKTIMVAKPNKDNSKVNNFRPISLISCISKLYERILAARISKHMERNNLYAKTQSGFRKQRMTTDQLLRLSEDCHLNFKEKKITAALFVDAEKAFDQAWHAGIKYKLYHNLNLPQRFTRLISSFLHDRKIMTCIDDQKSRLITPTAGTPQGSPLSPILYLILVNDIPNSINKYAELSQFADDISLWSSAYTCQGAAHKLQKAVNILESWCRQWRIKINGTKSNLLLIHRLKDKTPDNLAISMFDDIIKPCPERSATFLGVDIDDRLSFKKHFEKICGKAQRRLNVLKALSYGGVKKEILINLYSTYIRPLFEYGSLAFIATIKENFAKAQKIQNEAIRIALRLPSYLHIDRLHEAALIPKLYIRILSLNISLLQKMSKNELIMKTIQRRQDIIEISSQNSPLDIFFEGRHR